jgi:capsular exopolysaccharide synthesis family protein
VKEINLVESTEAVSLELRQSLREFQNCWLALKRRWLPATFVFGSVVGCSVLLACLQKPVYKAEGKLLFRTDRTPSLTGVGQAMEASDALAPQSNPMRTRMEVMQSIPMVQRVIDELKLHDEDGEALKPKDFIEKKIKLEAVKGTDILKLTYKSKNPQESARVVNKLMDLYINYSIQTSRAEANLASTFISQQLPRTGESVRQAEFAMRQFKERHHIISLANEEQAIAAAIATFNSQIIDLQRQLSATKAEWGTIRQQVGLDAQTAIQSASLSQSSSVQKALAELQAVESQLAVQRSRFQDSFPGIANLEAQQQALQTVLQAQVTRALGGKPITTQTLQMGELKQSLTRELLKTETTHANLATQLATLLKARTTYQQRAQILPKLQQEQHELQRQVDASQSTYQTLLKHLQEIKVAQNQAMGDAQILEQALVPDQASLRGPLMLVVLGILAGSLAALATVIRLEVQDKSLKTLRDVRELFGHPLLGVVPSFYPKARSRNRDADSEIPALPVQQMPTSIISESYRMLQANLKFSSAEQPRVITVTSSVPKEGKSTTAANLAAAIAQLGHRVLLVDADLRHPMQHRIWGLTNFVGLSHMLIGEATLESADSILQPAMPNLDIIPAGVTPPNPLALLNSKRMDVLVQALAKVYDFVIIDSPPLVAAADALTLGKLTDGLLLVSRPGVATAAGVRIAKEALERSDQTILGLVVNGILTENEPDSYFHFNETYYTEPAATAPSAVFALKA